MLPTLRRARIIELLRREGAAGLKDMSGSLGVSISTLRRDVDYLCALGHIERTHGGAVLIEARRAGVELTRDIATEVESAAKSAIGRAAADLIRPGMTVILDSGTTTAAAARAARDRGIVFTAITNDIAIAALLADSAIITLHVTGGMVRAGTSTLLGGDTLRAFARLRVDIAFVGSHAVSETGMSDTSVAVVEIKEAILSAADQPVLLADSSKMFSRSFCSFGDFSRLERLVTDTRLPDTKRAVLERAGLRVDMVQIGGRA
ncbi:MAG: hypothetical protein CFE34_05750 [Rhodobacteraceae bacterium PARR1]|nr:MAG: hypothetical protein CFE34_05750 [Rhodobacteraceae bacterium PARR1]